MCEVCEGDPIFLGSITGPGEPWMVDIDIGHKQVLFKTDTGADVTVIPSEIFKDIFKENVLPRGCEREVENSHEEDVYIIRNLHTAFLGRSTISKLGLVAQLDSIDIKTLKISNPKLCSGLGEVQQPYVISLKSGATPFSLKTPRRILLPLMGKVKEELHWMEMLGVISRVEEPTDWCAMMVVVLNKSGAVRICVDLSKLNESVRREKYILLSNRHLECWLVAKFSVS